jgi:hypothetical protein
MPDQYPQGIRIVDLRNLAGRSFRRRGEGVVGSDAVKTYYTWRDARALTVAKGVGAASISLLTAWIIPFFKNEYSNSSIWLVIIPPVFLIVSLTAFALTAVLRNDRIHGSYIRAMVWLERFQ